MDRGEKVIAFQISREGKVLPYPQGQIQSTSYEMQKILEDIVPRVAMYIENLLREKLRAKGGG